MSTGSRVRVLRKERGLTLERFGQILGVSKTAISKIERDENALTDTMARLISREFSVSERWLRTGEGEMEEDGKDRVIRDLVLAYDLDDNGKILIEEYVKLDPADRAALGAYLRALSLAYGRAQMPDENDNKR